MDMTSTKRPLRGTVRVPGDKSISHRALLFGAMARGTSRITGLSASADVAATRSALSALGIVVEDRAKEVLVEGKGLQGFRAPSRTIDCGNSGTTMRLLSGILAGQPFTTTLTGDDSLRTRPMSRVIDPLTSMGAQFHSAPDGRAPFSVTGRSPLRPVRYSLPVASAQVKSALLLAGHFAAGTTVVAESEPTRDHTERMLGLTTTRTTDGASISVEGPREPEPFALRVPGDPSGAAFLLAAASLLPGSELLLEKVSINPTRIAVFDLFRRHGVGIETRDERRGDREPSADLLVRASECNGAVEITPAEVPLLVDEIPVVAVWSALAGLPFSVSGASELRRKESDRIALLVSNFRAMGCDAEEQEDGFAIQPNNRLIGGRAITHGDHRIAMAFGVAGLVVDGISVDDPACVNVSFPGFWELLASLRR